MSAASGDIDVGRCKHHAGRETALRCGKCEEFICARCVVQTPVGARCRECAQIRRLPQFDVGLLLLLRSGLAGLLVSLVAWSVASFAGFFLYFLSVLVGVAVGEVMSRLARRRTSTVLEVVAVLDVAVGLTVVQALRFAAGSSGGLLLRQAHGGWAVSLLLPAAIASWVAVVKLR